MYIYLYHKVINILVSIECLLQSKIQITTKGTTRMRKEHNNTQENSYHMY